jgi:hypothetical protein
VARELDGSERKAYAVLGQHRSTQRKASRTAEDEAALTADIVELRDGMAAKLAGYPLKFRLVHSIGAGQFSLASDERQDR